MYAFVVLDLVSSLLCQEIGYENVYEMTYLCRVGCKTLTQSTRGLLWMLCMNFCVIQILLMVWIRFVKKLFICLYESKPCSLKPQHIAWFFLFV